ncbi:MAG: glycoside hydrolase family 25 protein [Candidatus Nanopelagicales bacterium]
MKRHLIAISAAGLCAGVAGAGLYPASGVWKPKPKATSWAHQGLKQIRGVDVSRWQHIGPGVLNFNKLQNRGVRFVVIKSGDTSWSAHREAGYWYARDKAAARRAGLLVGAYYYATPTSRKRAVVRDAKRQARKASARVGRLPKGHLPLALDLETEATSLGRKKLTRWTLTWLRVVEKRTGRTPWFYSYTRYMERRLLPKPKLLSYPLWHANWGLFLKDRPMQIRGWPADHARIWQFTDNGRLPGSGSRVLDLNVYRGTGEELLAEAGLGRKAAKRYGIPLSPEPTPSVTATPSSEPTSSPSPTVSAPPTTWAPATTPVP